MLGELVTPTHLIFVFLVALLIFGPKRIPELGKGFGKGIREFRGGLSGDAEKNPELTAKSPSGESARLS
jgi:sec-independent protein translocase protein TatA